MPEIPAQPLTYNDFLNFTPADKASASAEGNILGFLNNTCVRRPDGTDSNKNIAVIGSSGSMKTGGVIKNAIIGAKQRGESMLVIESNSELFRETAFWLRDAGYTVRTLNLQGNDDIDIPLISREKCAYFIEVSDIENDANNRFAPRFIQFFYRICKHHAETLTKQGQRAVLINIILDELALIGRIPDFDKLVSVSHDRTIIAAQSIAQICSIYGEHAATILLDNMDTQIFTGCSDISTAEYFSKLSGGTLVTVRGRGGKERTITRPNLTTDELMTLNPLSSIVFTRGHDYLICEKFHYTRDTASKEWSTLPKDYDPGVFLTKRT